MDEIINLCESVGLNDSETTMMLRLVDAFGSNKYNEGYDEGYVTGNTEGMTEVPM
jgi:hypothetical protein